MSRIFISHSSADNARAIGLGDWLKQNGWADFFLDLDPDRGIAAGERWLAAFMGAVKRCEAVIFLLSPAWVASHYCRHEVTAAKVQGKPIFGVIVEAVGRIDPQISEISAEWQLCDVSENLGTTDAQWYNGLPFNATALLRLARGLQRVGLGPSSFRWPPPNDPTREPYRGLSALIEDDAGIYFGRDAELVQCLDEVRRIRDRGVERLLVVLGTSGTGKSSFLRAGLLPRLDKDNEHFVVLPTIRPLRGVISNEVGLLTCLRAALRSHLSQSRSISQLDAELTPEHWAKLLLQFAAPPVGIDRPRTVVIPIDQAEELLDPAGAEEFDRFARLFSGPTPARLPVLLALTLRGDMWETFQSRLDLRALNPVLFNLPPMPATEFKAVIEEPARRYSEAHNQPILIDPRLVRRLLVDATDSSGGDTLPLLAFVLQLLFRRLLGAARIELSFDAYANDLQGFPGVIDRAAQEALAALKLADGESLPLLRKAFALLATVDPSTGKAQRREAMWASFERLGPDVVKLVSRLVEARLLVKSFRRGSDQVRYDTVEVAHESLLRQWGPMQRLAEEFAHNFRACEIVHRDALQWASSQSSETLQHRGERLREAEMLCTDVLLADRFDINDIAYLKACRRESNWSKRTTLLRRGVLLLLLLLVTGGVVFYSLTLAQSAAGTSLSLNNVAIDSGQINEERRALIVDSKKPVILITLSGDGARSALLALQVLRELRRFSYYDGTVSRRLIDDVSFISALSGGAITAAWFGLTGPDRLDELQTKFLELDNDAQLKVVDGSLANWIRHSTGISFERLLDQRLYGHKLFRELNETGKPLIVISATDMASKRQFPFVPSQFDLICSELDSVPIAAAVAATAGTQDTMPPLTITNHSGTSCKERKAPLWIERRMKSRYASYLNAELIDYAEYANELLHGPGSSGKISYLHLVGGGVTGAVGARVLGDVFLGPYSAPIITTGHEMAPLSALSAMNSGILRNIIIITVDASAPALTSISQSSKITRSYTSVGSLASPGSADAEIDSLLSNLGAGVGIVGASPMRIYSIRLSFNGLQLNDQKESDLKSKASQIRGNWTLSKHDISVIEEIGSTLLHRHPCFQRLLLDRAIPAPFIDADYARRGCPQAADR